MSSLDIRDSLLVVEAAATVSGASTDLLRIESIATTAVKVCDRATQTLENSLIEVLFMEGVLIMIIFKVIC